MRKQSASFPFLHPIRLNAVDDRDWNSFPFSLPLFRDHKFELALDAPVTFFVGENGSGKSTLIQSLAQLCGFPSTGGGTSDLLKERLSPLAEALIVHFIHRPKDGFFFRADLLSGFASLLDERQRDIDFWGDPYTRYGGGSLHVRSHGESFFDVLQNRIAGPGLWLLDEPESALSPQRQLALLAVIDQNVREGAQFIIATHSPILMSFPGAKILWFEDGPPREMALEDTPHFQITRDFLVHRERYLKQLIGDDVEG